MDEISINELLQRVIEGKAPKEVMIDDKKYKHNLINEIHDYIRVDTDGKIHSLFDEYNVSGILDLLNTKIKILDKPIIEELPLIEIKHDYTNGRTDETYEVQKAYSTDELADKINEIIKWINNKE